MPRKPTKSTRKFKTSLVYDPDDLYNYSNRFGVPAACTHMWQKNIIHKYKMPKNLTPIQQRWWCAHPLAHKEPWVPATTPEMIISRTQTNPIARRKQYVGSKQQANQKWQPPPGVEDLHCTSIRAKIQPRWDGLGGTTTDHPSRCTAFNRRTGKKCGHFSKKGFRLCRWHMGRDSVYNGSKKAEQRAYDGMGSIYSEQMKGTLEKFVEVQTGINPNEQLSCLDELALARHTCSKAVEDYSISVQGEEMAKEMSLADPSNSDLQKQYAKAKGMLLGCGAAMMARLQDVTKIADQAAKINNATKDSLSIHNLHFMVRQIVTILYEELGNDQVELVERINNAIKKEIKVLVDKPTGTDLTPSADAIEMDSSIPQEPEEGSAFDLSVVDAKVTPKEPQE